MSDTVKVHLPSGFDAYRMATTAQSKGINDPFLKNIVLGNVMLTDGASLPDVEIDVSKVNVSRLSGQQDQVPDGNDPVERGRRAMQNITNAATSSGASGALDTPKDMAAIVARPTVGGNLREAASHIGIESAKDLQEHAVKPIVKDLHEAARLLAMGAAYPNVPARLNEGLLETLNVVYRLKDVHKSRLLGLCDDETATKLKGEFHDLMAQITKVSPTQIENASLPAPTWGSYIKKDFMYALRDLSEKVFGEPFPEQLKTHFKLVE